MSTTADDSSAYSHDEKTISIRCSLKRSAVRSVLLAVALASVSAMINNVANTRDLVVDYHGAAVGKANTTTTTKGRLLVNDDSPVPTTAELGTSISPRTTGEQQYQQQGEGLHNNSKSRLRGGARSNYPSSQLENKTQHVKHLLMSDLSFRKQRNFLTVNQDSFRNHTSCPANLPTETIQTTLVTQLSTDRLWLAREICARWQDPIVMVVFFASQSTFTDLSVSFSTEMAAACPHVDLVLVVDDSPSNHSTTYPINVFRNLGLDAVKTSHVLVSDADFLPSEDLSAEIGAALQVRESAREQLRTPESDLDALVVPVFEYEFMEDRLFTEFPEQHSHLLPGTFDQLQSCLEEGPCSVFHERQFERGHSTTQSHLWLQKEWYEQGDVGPRDIKHISCLKSLVYEPYMVIRWCPSNSQKVHPESVAPLYDERFSGYGLNKIQLVDHVRHLGYDFFVVPQGFLVHAPHRTTKARGEYLNGESDLRKQVKSDYDSFRRELHQRHGDLSVKLNRCARG
jgi:hypothetical protein